jgi:hypothetical protein
LSLAALCLWSQSTGNCATIQLSWDQSPSTNVTGYKVWQSVGTSSFSIATNVTKAVTTVILPLSDTQVTRFYGTASSDVGDSIPSNVWTNTPTVLPTGPFALSAPTLSSANFQPGTAVSGTAKLTNGAASLVIEDGAFTTIAPGATDTGADWTPRLPPQTVAPGAIVTLTGTWTIPSAGPTGTWKSLMAVKVNGAWTDGPTTTFTVSTVPIQTVPNPPTNLRAVKISSSRLDLGWTSDLAAITKIERSIDGAPFGEIDTLPAGTQHTSTSFVKRKMYAFRARSLNSIGSSGYSNTAIFSSR